ncbi:MAG TPA: hypothetical protein VNU84_07765 [Candidatus Acidoferrum sp.]|nr:hypothetical protein [Candidatus Acidoferrum sp.]
MPCRKLVWLLCLAIIFGRSSGTAPAASAQLPAPVSSGKPDLVISGEVTAGNSFVRDIGGGLIFRLVPTPAGFGNGWDIEIVPKENPAGGYAEYSAIATPPYHFYNERYLNPSYGVTAREAVGISPRVFQFVETPEDSQAAYEVVNSVVYSSDWAGHKDSIATAAAKIQLGTGELKILESRITEGKNNEDLGSIDWVKFELALRFHSGVTLDKILFPDDSPKK